MDSRGVADKNSFLKWKQPQPGTSTDTVTIMDVMSSDGLVDSADSSIIPSTSKTGNRLGKQTANYKIQNMERKCGSRAEAARGSDQDLPAIHALSPVSGHNRGPSANSLQLQAGTTANEEPRQIEASVHERDSSPAPDNSPSGTSNTQGTILIENSAEMVTIPQSLLAGGGEGFCVGLEDFKQQAEFPGQQAESPNQPPEFPGQQAESPNQPPEFPGQQAESPNQPPEFPGQQAESPNQPPEFPGQQAESPNQPPECPGQQAESPRQPPESPRQPPECPREEKNGVPHVAVKEEPVNLWSCTCEYYPPPTVPLKTEQQWRREDSEDASPEFPFPCDWLKKRQQGRSGNDGEEGGSAMETLRQNLKMKQEGSELCSAMETLRQNLKIKQEGSEFCSAMETADSTMTSLKEKGEGIIRQNVEQDAMDSKPAVSQIRPERHCRLQDSTDGNRRTVPDQALTGNSANLLSASSQHDWGKVTIKPSPTCVTAVSPGLSSAATDDRTERMHEQTVEKGVDRPSASSQQVEGATADPCGSSDSAHPSLAPSDGAPARELGKTWNRIRKFGTAEVDIMLKVYAENKEVLNRRGSKSSGKRAEIYQVMTHRLSKYADTTCVKRPGERRQMTENDQPTPHSPASPDTPLPSDDDVQSATQNNPAATDRHSPTFEAMEVEGEESVVSMHDVDPPPSLSRLSQQMEEAANHCQPSPKSLPPPPESVNATVKSWDERWQSVKTEEVEIIAGVLQENRGLLMRRSQDQETRVRQLSVLQTLIDRLHSHADINDNEEVKNGKKGEQSTTEEEENRKKGAQSTTVEEENGKKGEQSTTVVLKYLKPLVDTCSQLQKQGVQAGTVMFEGNTVWCCGSSRLKDVVAHPQFSHLLSEVTSREARVKKSAERGTVGELLDLSRSQPTCAPSPHLP